MALPVSERRVIAASLSYVRALKNIGMAVGWIGN
jgi:hypothetical protein